MRDATWDETLEQFRLAGKRGERLGAFKLFCPATGRALHVIASDGSDWAACGLAGEPWEHVSVTLADRSDRCPSWPEMEWVRRRFFADDECVLQLHPPLTVYVNKHPGCLHLWRPTLSTVPMPPLECV